MSDRLSSSHQSVGVLIERNGNVYADADANAVEMNSEDDSECLEETNKNCK